MNKEFTSLLAGFGGQGILFMGKVIAYAGLFDEKEVSWLPSYGPEMRGGTANCSVTISDKPIGSPLVLNPNILVVMNLPSFDKFIDTVAPGGKVFVDSDLVNAKTDRTDIDVYYVPSTSLAESNNLKGLANIILIGKVFKETGFCSSDALTAAVKKCVPPKKAHLLEPNLKAIEIGMGIE